MANLNEVSPKNSIGILELSSIARGVECTDLMLKAADVELLLGRTICSGKYIILVRGDVAACMAALRAGTDAGRECVADSVVIPNLHDQVFPAISQAPGVADIESLGVLEGFNVSSLIEAADAAVKSAEVSLLEIRMAMALGGKAFAVLTGSVAAVTAAIQAGRAVLSDKGLLAGSAVIPAPKQEIVRELLEGRL